MQYSGEYYGDIAYPYCKKGYDVAFCQDESCKKFKKEENLSYEHKLWNQLYG